MQLSNSSVWIRPTLASENVLKRRSKWIQAAALVTLPFVLLGLGLDIEFMMSHMPTLLATIPLVIHVAFWSILIACVLGLLGALGRLSDTPAFYVPAGFYVSFFQGVPTIVVLFLIYFGLPSLNPPIILTSFQAAALGLALHNGAYLTEVFRASIESVSEGQLEAAQAIGMSKRQAMWRIVLPQAARNAIAPTANYYIFVVKDSSLLGFIGVAELFATARSIGTRDFKVLEMLFLATLLYWAITTVLSTVQHRLEARFGKAYVRDV